jgi:hypothetical protein
MMKHEALFLSVVSGTISIWSATIGDVGECLTFGILCLVNLSLALMFHRRGGG